MIVLLGESAAGKSAIEKELCEEFSFKKIVSYTTREPRNNEVDGKDYHFISDKKFLDLKEQEFFAESSVYNNWHYGIAKEDCKDNRIAVMTPHGFRQLKKIHDLHVAGYYLKVPRRDRLINQLKRGDDIEEAYRRNLSDVGQFDGIEDEVDFVIENHGYEKTIPEMVLEILKSPCIDEK